MTAAHRITVRIPRRLRARATSENLRAAILYWQDLGCPSLPAVREGRRAYACFYLRNVSPEKLESVAASQGLSQSELLLRILAAWADRKREAGSAARVAARIERAAAPIRTVARPHGFDRAAGRPTSVQEVPVRLGWQEAVSLFKHAGIPADVRREREYWRVGMAIVERVEGAVSRQWRLPKPAA